MYQSPDLFVGFFLANTVQGTTARLMGLTFEAECSLVCICSTNNPLQKGNATLHYYKDQETG
jgi:hypothetical protein